MAQGQIKYIIQYYALGANTYPYYNHIIYQDGDNWDVNDGPIYLETDGNEPVSYEMYESDGPIKPCTMLMNVVNKVYTNIPGREVEDTASVFNGVACDGVSVWACGNSGVIYKWTAGKGTGSSQTTPGTDQLNSIVASGTNIIVAVGNSGIYYTSDGSTWSDSASIGTENFVCVSASPASTDTFLAGGDNGAGAARLEISTDSGATWTNVDISSLSKINVEDVAMLDDTTAFIIADNDVYKISDLNTPATPTIGSANPSNLPGNNSCIFFKDNVMGVCTGGSSFDEQVFYTVDGGTTWTQTAADTSSSGNIDVAMLDNRTFIVFHDTTNLTIEYTTDSGATWTTFDNDVTGITGKVSTSYNTDMVLGLGAVFIATNAGELIRTTFTNYLREFKDFNLGEYHVVTSRRTAAYSGGTSYTYQGYFPLDNEYGYTEDWANPTGGLVQLRATDGLNLLQAREYRNSGALWTGRASLNSIIGLALEEVYDATGVNMRFLSYATYLNDALGSDFTTSPSDATNPFVNGFIDREYFMHSETQPYTWWETLEAILKSYDCVLISPMAYMQHAVTETPMIVASDRFYNTVDTDGLDVLSYQMNNASYQRALSGITYVRDLNNAEGKFQGIYQVLTKAYQYVDATIKNARPKNLVDDGFFYSESWESSSNLSRWQNSGATKAQLAISGSGVYSDYAMEITTTSATLAAAGYVKNIFQRDVTFKPSNEFLVRFYYKCDVTDSSSDENKQENPSFYVYIKFGNYYLWDGSTNKPETRSDLTGLAWTATESWLTIDIAGDDMDSWREFTIRMTDPPSDQTSGPLEVRFSECDFGSYTAGTDTLAIREVLFIVRNENGDYEWEDVRVTAENTAITTGKRYDLGDIHFYDFPEIDFLSHSSAVYPTLTFDTNGDYSSGTVRIELDETSREYTIGSYSVATRNWANITDLQKLLYEDSNNYIITTTSDTITITAIHPETVYDMDASAIISNPGPWAFNAGPTDATEPTVGRNFVNPASISDDATPTTMADWRWHAVTQEAAGTEDTRFWKLRLERELARRGKQTQRLQGTYKVIAEDEETFSNLIGLLPSGETNYKPVTMRTNTKMGQHEITVEKVHDEAVTFSGEELFDGN